MDPHGLSIVSHHRTRDSRTLIFQAGGVSPDQRAAEGRKSVEQAASDLASNPLTHTGPTQKHPNFEVSTLNSPRRLTLETLRKAACGFFGAQTHHMQLFFFFALVVKEAI
ncbi:hypothetical protein DFH08DRAFT_824846 [Mycena albidolilacea]|uniref:Uncharacterized protein n=1 Tax=Mycena albidolilacea TaxID=1033008 RepID=A0AAD7EAP2_9AGAR|nr:hypothetical protein DFH08DRAFT_824846 [Mycena albidolilacea]